MLLELRQCFMEAYDDNQDGKIDIREVILICFDIIVYLSAVLARWLIVFVPACFAQLAQLLPMEENFLLLFRFDNPLDSSVEFMKVM